MTCKLYHVLVAACALALANQVAGLAISNDKLKLISPAPLRIPKLPAFAGVTLSGMDFGSNTTSQTVSKAPSNTEAANPFTLPDFEQAIHYLEDRDVSLIKLPISWETLQHNVTKLEVYTDVVATVTSRNAAAVVSLSMSAVQFSNFTSNVTVHKDGPLIKDVANASFVEFWGKMAAHFQHDRRVIFHLMSIPQGAAIPRKWNETIQAAVTSIRKSGAQNAIILPSFAPSNGTTFNTFRDFPKDFERMQHIQNPDGTTDGIVFDLAQTLGPKSAKSQRCQGVDVSNIVDPVVKILKENKRQAIVGTLAGGSDPSCTRTLVKFAKEVSKSYPSLAGFVMYGAGAFDQSAPWSLIKEGEADSSHCTEEWVDQPNFNSVQPYFPKKAKDTDSSGQKPEQDSYDQKSEQEPLEQKPEQESSEQKPEEGSSDQKPEKDSSDQKPKQGSPDQKPKQSAIPNLL